MKRFLIIILSLLGGTEAWWVVISSFGSPNLKGEIQNKGTWDQVKQTEQICVIQSLRTAELERVPTAWPSA